MADMFLRNENTNYKVTSPYIRQGNIVYRVLAKYQNIDDTIYNLFSTNLITWFRYRYYYENIEKLETYYSTLDDGYTIDKKGSFGEAEDLQFIASSESESNDNSAAVVCSSYTFSRDEGFKSAGTIYGTTFDDLRIGYYVVTATRVFYITDSYYDDGEENWYNYTIIEACKKFTDLITERVLKNVQYDGTVYGETPKYSEDDYYIGEGSIEEGEFTLYDIEGEACFNYFRKPDITTATKTVDVNICGTQYTLPRGMTWREFVSKYNTTNDEGYEEFIIRNGDVLAYSLWAAGLFPDDPYSSVVYWVDDNFTNIKASYPIDAFDVYDALDE